MLSAKGAELSMQHVGDATPIADKARKIADDLSHDCLLASVPFGGRLYDLADEIAVVERRANASTPNG